MYLDDSFYGYSALILPYSYGFSTSSCYIDIIVSDFYIGEGHYFITFNDAAKDYIEDQYAN